jgi:anti-sigma factor RsiW
MHKCKTSETTLTELALDEVLPGERERLLAELQDCPNCREEYFAIERALRATGDALRSFSPPESFWSGYHARLEQHLASNAANTNLHPTLSARLRQLFSTSIRIPVPVAAALMVAFVATALLAVDQSRNQPAFVEPSIPPQTQIVNVPVIREEVVTRVVFVKKALRASAELTRPAHAEPREKALASFAGFQPTNQVNLTVIKGSSVDDK